jgi:hypothetical protein
MKAALMACCVGLVVCASGWFASEQRCAHNIAIYRDFQRRIVESIPVRYLTQVSLGEFE